MTATAGHGIPPTLGDALFSTIRDAVLAVDSQGRITAWLAGAATVFGWSADEAVGRPIQQMLPLDPGTLADSGEVAATAWHRDGREFPVRVRSVRTADG